MSSNSAVGPVGRADAMGWASVGLAAPMILVPRRLLQTIGVRPDGRATATIAAVGVRELMATVQINAMRQRRIGMWARVAGDSMDLALLGVAFARRRQDTQRLAITTAVIAAISGLDLVTALQMRRADRVDTTVGEGSSGIGAPHEESGGPAHLLTAVTIARPVDEVRSAFHSFAWSAFDPAQAETGQGVRFVPAPGDRGTEVHLDVDPPVPGGRAGAAVLKLTGRAPDQRISDELRQFKSMVETGVVARSDKTPEGPSSARQIMQLPGNPQEGNR